MATEFLTERKSNTRMIALTSFLAAMPLFVFAGIWAFIGAARLRFGHWPTFSDPKPAEIGWGIAHSILWFALWVSLLGALGALGALTRSFLFRKPNSGRSTLLSLIAVVALVTVGIWFLHSFFADRRGLSAWFISAEGK